MYTVHATRKLLERLKAPPVSPVVASSSLGGWYATVEFWKPQVAMFVNTASFMPIFMPLAPAASVIARFPTAMATVLNIAGIDPRFVAAEVDQMGEAVVAKTADRQMLGVMNELGFMAEARIGRGGFDPTDLVGLSIKVADTLISPLYKNDDRGDTPLDELRRLVALAVGEQ